MASVRADQLEVYVRCRVRREPVVPSSAVAKKLAEVLCELAIGPQQAPQDKRFAAVETAAEDAAALQPLPFREDQALGRTLEVAREHRLSTYDACYLELAERMRLPLATLDADLAKAAREIGVGLLEAS